MIESNSLKENSKLKKDLKQIPTLEVFEEDDLNSLLKYSRIRKYKSGETIIREGSFDPYVYFLIYGNLTIYRKGKLLAALDKRGEIFGEMSVIGCTARSASVLADGEAVCLATDTNQIKQLVGRDRLALGYVLYRIFSETLADRLKNTNDELVRAKGKNWKFWQ